MPRALVVDDSKAVRMILVRSLRGLGFEVAEAADGRAALATLAENGEAVDLVLSDWNMPVMNGFELLTELRRNPKLAPMTIVMVTTETEVSQVESALKAGANEYIMKPFTQEILVEKLGLLHVLPKAGRNA